MHDQFLFITYDENKELRFASYYSDLDEIFLKHRFKIPLHILKRIGYAKNSSDDGSGCLLFYLDYSECHTFIDFKLQQLLTSALREVKLKELGI
jgi:hypothetical protein